MIEVLDGMDLSGLPIPFLESFPFPAFVLAIPIASGHAPLLHEPPVFSSSSNNDGLSGGGFGGRNDHLPRRQSSLSPLSTSSTSVSAANLASASASTSAHTHTSSPLAKSHVRTSSIPALDINRTPVGRSSAGSISSIPSFPLSTIVWSNEKWSQITEGRPIRDCLGQGGADKLQDWIEGRGSSPNTEQHMFTIDIREPALRLTLCKTIIPLSPPSSTHTFCVITSQPRLRQSSSVRGNDNGSDGGREGSTSPVNPCSPVILDSTSPPAASRSSKGSIHKDFEASRSTSTMAAAAAAAAEVGSISAGVSANAAGNGPASGLGLGSSLGPPSSSATSASGVTPTPGDLTPTRQETPTQHYNDSSRSGSNAGSSAGFRTRSSTRKRMTASRPEPMETAQKMHTSTDECWDMVEKFDWASTPLGPRELWRDTIDPLLSVVFQSNSMDCVWLGEDMQLIYNKQYSQIVEHPRSFGQPGRNVWQPIWDYIEPHVAQALSGSPVYFENDLLLFKKFGPGLTLECYFTWRYVPITGKDGRTLGIYNQAYETTEAVLAERRLNTARELSEQLLISRTVKEFYTAISEALETNPKDVPFGMVYSVNSPEILPKDATGNTMPVTVKLESSIGVPEKHPSAPTLLNLHIPVRTRSAFGPNADRLSSPTLSAISALSSGGSGRRIHIHEEPSWPILKALSTRQCVLIEDCRSLIDGFPIRQWEELPTSALVVPISSENASEVPGGLMIIGLNLRRPFDAEYESWIHEIRTQLASTLVSVKGYESEQKRIDDALKMEKAKAAWFRGAAHDLRSPLTLINGPIEELLDTKLTGRQRNHLQLAKRNIDRLMRLVNALMDFSRLEAGRVQGRFVPIDLGSFVSELAALFRPALEKLRIDYIIDVQPFDRLVYVDPTLLETVLSNLISNALKYTESGSVTIRVRYGETEADVAIIDTGIGIPQDEIEHVAEWFHRASTAVHAGTTGTGLGLALARELLKLHGGDLIVTSCTEKENPENHGSTFIARLPLVTRSAVEDGSPIVPFGQYGNAAANEAIGWVRENRAKSDAGSSEGGMGSETQNSSGTGSGSYSKMGEGLMFEKEDVLLVVDDSIDMRDYLRRIFSPFCRVIEAGTGEEALVKALDSPPSLILSDIMMPKMTGTELLEAVRAQSTVYVPMILLSAMTSDEARVDALLAGAEDYLEKPFRPKELVARVHLHMQVGKKRNTLEHLFMEREVQIRFLTEYCPSGIMRADPEGHLTYCNAAWRTLAGMGEDADPETWPDYCPPDVAEKLLAEWRSFLVGDQKEMRTTWRWKNGTVVSAVFIRLDILSPGMSGIIGCMSDISHEEQRIIDAEMRRKEAEESKHQQELLIDLTSHEIRTPVSAILQCSSLVKENLLALKGQLHQAQGTGFKASRELLEDIEEDIEALESIYQCGLVQERIAGDILSLARIQLDMLSLHDVNMDIKKEGRKAISVFASEAKMKRIQLALEFGESIEKSQVWGIKTDPVRLGQIVTNLISNAIRFTASSSTRKITVTYNISFVPPADNSCALPKDVALPPADQLPPKEDTTLWFFVSVRDTGPGLGPKELAVLFKRFSQGNAMIHTRYGGSGLGLFICKKISELLGGHIEVLSTVGEGSVFRFYIQTRAVAPLSEVEKLIEASANQSLPSRLSGLTIASNVPSRDGGNFTASPSPSADSVSPSPSIMSSDTPPPPGMESLHILIVEDNIINQTVLKRQIVKAGLTCDVADNGLEALTLIREADSQKRRGVIRRQRSYNVIVMDLEMPVMDGLTTIREIRALEAAGTLERNMVIALTGNARQGQIDQALAAGMDDVVIKPYVLSNLLGKIQGMWSKKMEFISARQSA